MTKVEDKPSEIQTRSEIADGMRVFWDVPVEMEDGIVLRADIFMPIEPGRYPAILSYGPYSKGLAFQEGFKGGWDRLVRNFPEVAEGTSNKYACFELVDPEKWVPDGYACVRVDSRGAGRSPGYLDPKSIRETEDLYQCIEWAADQSWCSGKVGLNGISYFATNQWYVASMQPPHLAAICAWEGAADYYRDNCRHGGILCDFLRMLYPWAVHRVQHGYGERGYRNHNNGELVAGPPTLSDEELIANRKDVPASLLAHPLDDDYYSARSTKWDKVTVPMLSAGNWGGMGLHPRGNFEGFMRAASDQKWLEVHGDSHWTHFYTNYGVALQKQFFGHFLKGENNGWGENPPVLLNVRHVDRFEKRYEHEWPLARTQWTRYYLHTDSSLSPDAPAAPAKLAYDPTGEGLQFLTAPFARETELTGPVAAKLFVSSKSRDADLFLVLHCFAPDGKEVVFQGSNDPHVPIGLGWLRVSQRKLHPELTRPYRPYHTHDEVQPLTPGVPVEVDVEIWPTCLVIPKGYRLGLSVRGKDYQWKDGPPVKLEGIGYEMGGVGPFRHDNPVDRPPGVFNAEVTLHLDPANPSYLLLPIIPEKS